MKKFLKSIISGIVSIGDAISTFNPWGNKLPDIKLGDWRDDKKAIEDCFKKAEKELKNSIKNETYNNRSRR